MLGSLSIFIYPLLYLGANGQDLICSTSTESSCPAVIPLVSGTVCPKGFDLVEKQCFKVINNAPWYKETKSHLSYNFNESIQICEELNAKLAEPRALLDSAEFLKYLFIKGSYFGLGGYYTNNSWEWLTGGKIYEDYNRNISRYYSDRDCLRIRISYTEDYWHYWDIWYENWDGDYYDYYYWYEYRTLIPINLDAFEFELYGYPCKYSTRYICQAIGEYNSYLSCNLTNGTILQSGTLVSMNEQQCQQTWCQNGTIEQYGCGNITNSCCVHDGKLYGDGDTIGPMVPRSDCKGCEQMVCQAGNVGMQECTNCSVTCCLFNGKAYQPGSYIPNACARLVCEGTTGKFEYRGIDRECPKCKVYLDPHIVTYDQKWYSYSYQGCGQYSLSQNGSTYWPTLAVYATFKSCGGSSDLSCVDTVVFKNDNYTIITLQYDSSEKEFKVNGNSTGLVTDSSPSILQSMGTSYPVLVWIKYNCINLQGSSGILVKFCGSSWANQVYIWASPDITEDLEGLCGTVTGDVNDDFQSRNGTIYSPWQRNPPLDFPLSWLTTSASNGSCGNGELRAKREVQSQNECDVNQTVLAEYNSQCTQAVESGFSNAEEDEVQTIIDDCVYDLCNVTDPGEWIRAVQETVQVQAEIQTNTQDFSPPTTSKPDTTATPTTPKTTAFDSSTTTSDITTHFSPPTTNKPDTTATPTTPKTTAFESSSTTSDVTTHFLPPTTSKSDTTATPTIPQTTTFELSTTTSDITTQFLPLTTSKPDTTATPTTPKTTAFESSTTTSDITTQFLPPTTSKPDTTATPTTPKTTAFESSTTTSDITTHFLPPTTSKPDTTATPTTPKTTAFESSTTTSDITTQYDNTENVKCLKKKGICIPNNEKCPLKFKPKPKPWCTKGGCVCCVPKTPNCMPTNKCKENRGVCLKGKKKQEKCDGTLDSRHCKKRKCACCWPNCCKESSKCAAKGGFCTTDAKSCEDGLDAGTTNDKLKCGKGCTCCINKVCVNDPSSEFKSCTVQGGKCTSDKKACKNDGGRFRRNVGCIYKPTGGKGPKRRQCGCCLPKKPKCCVRNKKCIKKKGKCISSLIKCKGKVIPNGCKGDLCQCCAKKKNTRISPIEDSQDKNKNEKTGRKVNESKAVENGRKKANEKKKASKESNKKKDAGKGKEKKVNRQTNDEAKQRKKEIVKSKKNNRSGKSKANKLRNKGKGSKGKGSNRKIVKQSTEKRGKDKNVLKKKNKVNGESKKDNLSENTKNKINKTILGKNPKQVSKKNKDKASKIPKDKNNKRKNDGEKKNNLKKNKDKKDVKGKK